MPDTAGGYWCGATILAEIISGLRACRGEPRLYSAAVAAPNALPFDCGDCVRRLLGDGAAAESLDVGDLRASLRQHCGADNGGLAPHVRREAVPMELDQLLGAAGGNLSAGIPPVRYSRVDGRAARGAVFLRLRQYKLEVPPAGAGGVRHTAVSPPHYEGPD